MRRIDRHFVGRNSSAVNTQFDSIRTLARFTAAFIWWTFRASRRIIYFEGGNLSAAGTQFDFVHTSAQFTILYILRTFPNVLVFVTEAPSSSLVVVANEGHTLRELVLILNILPSDQKCPELLNQFLLLHLAESSDPQSFSI